ncbi:hypothetical protein [Streptomyces sp. 4R-3d]|uniref:DUF6197 family protein n=1 Tax=Streptomyces sp. 4R-3d TaxID=2559605 RepID=UPI001071CED2|nr:hypothetical protein [Streptomyces sp. 4R-3d]TFI30091.1 hypothetical protein E4P36_04905 [Streptomyces sp. 4R-3d]
MNASTSSDLFRQAAQIIRKQGHAKGSYTNPRGCVCALGALSTAATGNPTPAETIDPDLLDAMGVLSARIDSDVVDEDDLERIADWNDRDSTTATDVIAALEAAAEATETTAQIIPLHPARQQVAA